MMESPNEDGWRQEAKAVIADIQNHVSHVSISSRLSSSRQRIYLNVTTLEGQNICVELTGHGFRVVGTNHDVVDQGDGRTFETPYSLLDSISTCFRESFSSEMMKKLSQIAEDQQS